MAYAALASLAQTIDLILNYHQDSVSPQVKDQLTSIHKYIILLQAFLEDFPDKADNLEGRIREVTHEAEDTIEFLLSDALLKPTVGSSKPKFKRQLRGAWKQTQSRYELLKSTVGSSKSKFKLQSEGQYGHLELKRVAKEIKSIAEKVTEIRSSITVKDVRPSDAIATSSSSSVAPVHKDAMVGFDNDLMEIKSRLCRESSMLEVIPIVGMGGIGKTTLARNAYDDPLVMERFQIRAWVIVSQDYSVQEIVSSLLVSMKLFEAKDKSMEALHVYQTLKRRRYLIVLDDIWSIQAWDDLKMMFPDDGNGSRIMLTTRLLDVASYANSSSPVHEMRLMDEDQSWNLLRDRVFRKDPCPVELEDVGKMIVRSCKGLPLAIVVISGLLAVDQTQTAWFNIAEDVTSAFSANDERFDRILSLSYTHLPHYLRPCFLYIGGFPEDYEMRASILIKLWVAEGFLRANGSKSFEETAQEYLEDLVKRSLIFVTKRKSNGRIKIFTIHDLMREMCVRKAQEENFFLHVRGFLREDIKISRRVSTVHPDLDFHKHVNGLSVRTIIYLHHRHQHGSLKYFRLLRILDLSCFYRFHKHDRSFTCLPPEVYELFHLRYLAFDQPFTIGAAISNLQNLQTLIISTRNHVTGLFWLPVEIWRMPQLRHLLILSHLLPFQEGAVFGLENLQTLSTATNFVCSPEIMKMIPNLKKLGLSYTITKDKVDYQLHNLIHLQQLENLKLVVGSNFPYREKVNPSFPYTLKKLSLRNLGLPWKDMKIVGSLPNLEVLKLKHHACHGDTWETTEGEFSELRFLLIYQSNLQHWMTESNHFPRLKCLVLRKCSYLSKIPDEIGDIATLELIEMDALNKSLEDSAKQIEDDQRSCGNNDLQVRVIPKGWWDY